MRPSRSLTKGFTSQTEEHWGSLHKLRSTTLRYTLHCTLYTVHCTLYTVYSTLYTVQFSHQTFSDNFPPKIFNQFFSIFPHNFSTHFCHTICQPNFSTQFVHYIFSHNLPTNFSTQFSFKLFTQLFNPYFPLIVLPLFLHTIFQQIYPPNLSNQYFEPNLLYVSFFTQISTQFFHPILPPIFC